MNTTYIRNMKKNCFLNLKNDVNLFDNFSLFESLNRNLNMPLDTKNSVFGNFFPY